MNPFDIPNTELDRIVSAVGPANQMAYAATCVYPMAAPAFTSSPLAERERPQGDLLRLYVHIPFCNYACSFCFFAVKIGAQRDQMNVMSKLLEQELEWVDPASCLSQLFVGGGTPTSLPPDLLDSYALGRLRSDAADRRWNPYGREFA